MAFSRIQVIVYNASTKQNDTVTVTKSDWAWNAYFSGYTKSSSSTFVHNCFSYAVSAPTVTFYDGWNAFTDGCQLNEATSIAYSGHAIKITVSHDDGCDPDYWVSNTNEKNASSGTYCKSWTHPGRSTSGYTLGKHK